MKGWFFRKINRTGKPLDEVENANKIRDEALYKRIVKHKRIIWAHSENLHIFQ